MGDTFRQDKLKDFTVIRNAIFRDYRLSAKAVGVACKLLSLPPTWEYSVKGIAALFMDGETSIRNALLELEECGYLSREQVRAEGKFGKSVYTITDSLKAEKPRVENPMTDNPMTEKPSQYNTKELNTNKSNTKRFIPPSVEDVREYIAEKGYHVDAERFIDYYTSNGWMVGKNRMKDWKATVRNWERNSDKNRSNESGAQKTPEPSEGWECIFGG